MFTGHVAALPPLCTFCRPGDITTRHRFELSNGLLLLAFLRSSESDDKWTFWL